MLVTPSLKGLWRFEGNANDASGQGNHGTVVGATLSNDGKFGKCYSFDGTDDYIGLPVSDNVSAITVSLWYNTDQESSRAIWLHTGSNPGTYFGHNYGGADTLEWITYDGNVHGVRTTVSGSTEPGIWHHIAGTFDGSFYRLYLDGEEVGSSEDSIWADASANFDLGRRSDYEDMYFNGLIDEVMIFNKALSLKDIQRLYVHLHPLNG